MARKAEPGISYYPMNANHIFNKKIKLLFADFDADGYWIYCCLLSEIYSNKGYYLDCSDKDHLTLFSTDTCKKPLSRVIKVIDCCIKRDLFDKLIYEKHKVLTSDRIQDNYLTATYERRRIGTQIHFIKEYLLIDFSKNKKNVVVKNLNRDSSAELSNNKAEKSGILPVTNTQSKVEKSKPKKIKEEHYRSFAHLFITVTEYKTLEEMGYSGEQIDSTLDQIENYKANKKYDSLYLTAKIWLEKRHPEGKHSKPKMVD